MGNVAELIFGGYGSSRSCSYGRHTYKKYKPCTSTFPTYKWTQEDEDRLERAEVEHEADKLRVCPTCEFSASGLCKECWLFSHYEEKT